MLGMDPIYQKCVDSGVREVLEMIAGMSVQAGDPYPMGGKMILGEMSAIIGLSGKDMQGAVVLHFDKPLAFHLLKVIFETETTELTDEVLDAVGEITNMISGKFKTDLVNSGRPEFNITVPTIVVGQNYQTYIRGVKGTSTIFPYKDSEGKCTLNVELKIQQTA